MCNRVCELGTDQGAAMRAAVSDGVSETAAVRARVSATGLNTWHTCHVTTRVRSHPGRLIRRNTNTIQYGRPGYLYLSVLIRVFNTDTGGRRIVSRTTGITRPVPCRLASADPSP